MADSDRLLAMNAAHAAFRRDLERLATAAAAQADLRDPARHASVLVGWATFKNQMRKHHEGEDRYIWPRLRERLEDGDAALVVLDEMDAEHARIEPLLKAVDDALDGARHDGQVHLAHVVDELITVLTEHLEHEERQALPLIGKMLTDAEWEQVMAGIRASADVRFVAEYLPWLGDGVPAGELERIETLVPPPFRAAYRQEWKPAYSRTRRW
jgi:hemerythrin-like domain-containing protein